MPASSLAGALTDAWPFGTGSFAAGTRVRVTPEGLTAPRTIGWIQTAEADTLWLQTEPNRAVVPFSRSAVTRIETSDGMKRHTARGIILGLLVGSVAGFTIGAGLASDNRTSDTPAVVAGVIAGGCTFLGGYMGYSFRSERWAKVYED